MNSHSEQVSFAMRLLLTLFFLATTVAHAQIAYEGSIDNKYPIHLVMDASSEGGVEAFYVYDKFDTPINIYGSKKGNVVTLLEKDAKGIVTGKLTFNFYDERAAGITGEWSNKDGSKKMPIKLTKQFNTSYDATAYTNVEMIQLGSTPNHYFKIVLSKEKDNRAFINGVVVYEKKTDKLIQKFDVECQLQGVNNTNVGDFNFDGVPDFSVFEASYAGANTSSLYFLKGASGYFNSGYEGTSLEFDATSKVITTTNSCCAGTSIESATYKVVDNKMVLVKKECYQWSEKKQDHVLVKCTE